MQMTAGTFNNAKVKHHSNLQSKVRNFSLESVFDDRSQPHTPEQELTLFGSWIGKPIWVPPNDCSNELAKSMLNKFGPFAKRAKCWQSVVRKHRGKFTQVREMRLPKASIRLPKGRIFVTVTEKQDFDKIEEQVPACVQTRLNEFLNGPGKQKGVKVFYLKPLCVEVGNELIFTKRDEIEQSINQVQNEVFEQYRKQYPLFLLKSLSFKSLNAMLSVPRNLLTQILNRRKREIEDFHAKLEFERRKRAMKAVKLHKKYRKDECTFDEVLNLTTPPKREDVIDHYVKDNVFEDIDRKMFLLASAASLPWFAALSIAAYQIAVVSVTTTVSVSVCDPAFVAQMPGSNGDLLKIGHFDEVDGVMHVEI